MTLPIDFVDTPHDLGTDNADAEDAFGNVASVTDTNFEKINAFHRAVVPKVYTNPMLSKPGTFTLGAYTDFPAANWPAMTVTIPDSVSQVLLFLGSRLNIEGFNGLGNWVATTARLAGTSVAWTQETLRTLAYEENSVMFTVLFAIPAANLTPGTPLVVTPQYFVGGTDPAGPASLDMSYGHMYALVM